MMEGLYEIMDREETAKYLKIGKLNLYRKVKKSKSNAIYTYKLSEHNEFEEVLTHVSTKDLSAIKNPLDSLLTGGGI